MTTIIYCRFRNKVIQIRHSTEESLEKVLRKFPGCEVIEDYSDIRKINKDISAR